MLIHEVRYLHKVDHSKWLYTITVQNGSTHINYKLQDQEHKVLEMKKRALKIQWTSNTYGNFETCCTYNRVVLNFPENPYIPLLNHLELNI